MPSYSTKWDSIKLMMILIRSKGSDSLHKKNCCNNSMNKKPKTRATNAVRK